MHRSMAASQFAEGGRPCSRQPWDQFLIPRMLVPPGFYVATNTASMLHLVSLVVLAHAVPQSQVHLLDPKRLHHICSTETLLMICFADLHTDACMHMQAGDQHR